MTARQRERERGKTERSLKLHSGCSVNSKLTHYPVASLRKRARLSLEWCRRDSTTGTKNPREFSVILKKYTYIYSCCTFSWNFLFNFEFYLDDLGNEIIFLSIYIIFFLCWEKDWKGQNFWFFDTLPFSDKQFYLYYFFFSKILCNLFSEMLEKIFQLKKLLL